MGMHECHTKLPHELEDKYRKRFLKQLRIKNELKIVVKKLKQVTNRPQDSPGGNRG